MIEPAGEDSQLDLLFASREGLVDAVMAGGCLGHKNHEIIVLVLGGVRRGASRTNTLNSRGQTGLFRRLVDTIPWEAVLKGKEVQEGWTFFKREILKALKQAILM